MIMITGSLGFIGKRVIRHFNSLSIDQGQDITDAYKTLLLPECEGVIHLAAISRVSECKNNPIECMRVNILGLINILEYCRRHKAWLVFASTREAARMDNIYAISKHTGENLCYRYAKDYNMRILICRLGDIHGAGDNPDKVIPTITTKAKANQIITLHNPTQQFDFVHINQAVKELVVGAKKVSKEIAPFCERIDITSGKLTSLQELAESIVKKCKSKSKIEYAL